MADDLDRIRRNVNAVRKADWGDDPSTAYHPERRCQADLDADALLSRLDSLTAAVDGLPPLGLWADWDYISREAVLALIRGDETRLGRVIPDTSKNTPYVGGHPGCAYDAPHRHEVSSNA